MIEHDVELELESAEAGGQVAGRAAVGDEWLIALPVDRTGARART